MMNELVKNKCDVTNHQVNVQFLLQLQPEWQRFVTLVKQSKELKTHSYHKLYDILKQHQNEVNEIRAERLAQQAATRNRGKAIANSPQPTYDQEPAIVAEDDEMSKEKEIDKLMDLISLLFKKIYKPTNNNLRTSSNTLITIIMPIETIDPFGELELTDTELRETSYEIFIGACRSTGGTRPLTYVSQSSGKSSSDRMSSLPSLQRSVTLKAASKVKKSFRNQK
ncbi:putative ribonuclease H-like domain-containing protein [Tanacetum coccineum]